MNLFVSKKGVENGGKVGGPLIKLRKSRNRDILDEFDGVRLKSQNPY